MNIIYHCYGGAHSSVTAAAINLGWLDAAKTPSYDELINIPYFDVQIKEDHGIFRFMGEDEEKNKVYIIGRRNLNDNFELLVYSLARIYDLENDFLLVDTMPLVNWKMIIGGFFSRGLQTPKFGKKLVVSGVQDAFHKYVSLVTKVKNLASNSCSNKLQEWD